MTIFSKEINDIILRRWKTTDDQQLFKLASDPDIGQRAGWRLTNRWKKAAR